MDAEISMRYSYMVMLAQKNDHKVYEMQKRLLFWSQNNLKMYPWRCVSDPYKILISEILLQKTDSAKVEKVYPQFVQHFPTVERLAEAGIDEIGDLIKGLGLSYRALRFKKMSHQIVREFKGAVPEDMKGLLSLYGVGDYIGSAVLCFAYKNRVPIVDTNVIRIFERVFGLKSLKSRPRMDRDLWKFAEEVMPEENYVSYNYALLDFASEVCRAKNPLCETCPLSDMCSYYIRRNP